jgi:hypothetical protein
MREFIGLVPKKRDLLDIYKRNIIVVSPNGQFEPCFMDLAAAVGSQMVQTNCGNGDIKDTYSFLLAMLANIGFFVTEDKDVKRLYQYFSKVKNLPYDKRNGEIAHIKDLYRELNPDSDFPIDRVLTYLFSENTKSLTIPVSILQLENTLPQVLDKFENVIWMYRSIGELEHLTLIVDKLPPDWDHSIIEKARKKIGQIASSVGLQPNDEIDESTLKTRLIESEHKWSFKEEDEDLGLCLDSQFNILHQIIFEEERDSSHDYASMEEYYETEEATKSFTVKCENCGQEFDMELDYRGVTEVDQREMGAEMFHEWAGDEQCPECGSDVSIMYEIYEYPEWAENDNDIHCDGCEVVPIKPPEKPPAVTLKDFM